MGSRVLCVCLHRTNTSSSALWLDIDQSFTLSGTIQSFPATVRILTLENKQLGNFHSHFLSHFENTPHTHIYKQNTFLKRDSVGESVMAPPDGHQEEALHWKGPSLMLNHVRTVWVNILKYLWEAEYKIYIHYTVLNLQWCIFFST